MSTTTHLDLCEILSGEDEEPEWLVEDMIYKGQMICWAGAPGIGKSYILNALAMSIACRLPFLGKTTTYGKTLYFDEENSTPDLRKYLRDIWRGLGSPDMENLAQSVFHEHFTASAQTNRFNYMKEKALEYQPSLIIIDTATTVCGIKDENDNAEASRAIAGLRGVQRVVGPKTTMIVLKHQKFTHEIGESRTIRGAKTWLNELDMVLYHVGAVGHPRKDGLRNTQLVPDKVRGYGLKMPLKVFPDEFNRGIRLSCEKSSI